MEGTWYGGLGLGLVVTPRKSSGLSKTWAQAVSPNGRKTSLRLGSYPVVTLAMAREKALANARAIAEGRDPRRRMLQVPTFAQANETVIAIHAESWKSDRSESQWRASKIAESVWISEAPRATSRHIRAIAPATLWRPPRGRGGP